MFNFFKRKGGKAEAGTAEPQRKQPSDHPPTRTSVEPRSPENQTNDTLRKDVVNLLIPETNYTQKSGVGAIFEIMAGKRRKNKRKTARAESCRVSPQKETVNFSLQRSASVVEPTCKDDVAPAQNTPDSDPADFVKALVLQKYARPEKHVSLVYVSDAPDVSDEKRHAEALLREIARSIDCTIDEIHDQMGAAETKPQHVYETIEERNKNNNTSYKNELKSELDKLLQTEEKSDPKTDEESPAFTKKSNLKLPKSDTEGCSDDDKSDSGKKRVTFRKHIVFDDGEQQTDDDLSFESLTSEEDEEYLEDSLPDNDELLGGVVVSRNENDNKTIININENDEPIQITVVDELKRISSDNSDSGFIDSDKHEDDETSEKSSVESESEISESETEEEIIEIVEEEVSYDIEEPEDDEEETKTLVSQETKFQSQVAALTELADSRCGESERARQDIAACRKEIEQKDQEIEQLKCSLAAAYKESELVRQRSRSLEEELGAARSCSADLADQLQRRKDESLRQLHAELEDALTRRAELESRVLALESDRDRLEQEKAAQEQKAQEAIAAAEAGTAKWRAAHEAARAQAAARAELMLADCEWKMRELEKKARDQKKQKEELAATVEQLKAAPPSPSPTPSQLAELEQLRGLATDQQRSVQSLTLQLQKVETREEALKLEVHRLKELLDRATRVGEEKDQRHLQKLESLTQQHSQALESLRAAHASSGAAARSALERAHAERTRAALAQLRAEAERDARNADRKLREVTTKFESLKEELASKQAEFETAIAQAHSKADWDVMQLRHLLDRADIAHANAVEQLTEKFELERDTLVAEWSERVRVIEEEAAAAAGAARKLLETTRSSLIAEKNDLLNKMRDQHRREMDEQWEQFMTDKESCLQRMKAECRQEGEEDRVQREKELLEEITELKAQIQSKSIDFETLSEKAAQCGRTLEVTEQELREALSRERELRERRGEDATKMKQLERASREQVEHLHRKCACLRKLFDDVRSRLSAKERTAEQEARAKEKELHQLRAEVARLTKILVEQSSPKLGARTRADGCETESHDESFLAATAPLAAETQPNPPRRKGGTLRTPEFARKRPTLPELSPLPPEARRSAIEILNGRRRARSVDLPAVQVPVRIKQLEEKK